MITIEKLNYKYPNDILQILDIQLSNHRDVLINDTANPSGIVDNEIVSERGFVTFLSPPSYFSKGMECFIAKDATTNKVVGYLMGCDGISPIIKDNLVLKTLIATSEKWLEKENDPYFLVAQIATHNDYRKKGIATMLYKHLFEYKSTGVPYKNIITEIAMFNKPSSDLHRVKLGFEEIAHYSFSGRSFAIIKKSLL